MNKEELLQAKKLLEGARFAQAPELIRCLELCFVKIHQLETSIHCQGNYPLELAARDFGLTGGGEPIQK